MSDTTQEHLTSRDVEGADAAGDASKLAAAPSNQLAERLKTASRQLRRIGDDLGRALQNGSTKGAAHLSDFAETLSTQLVSMAARSLDAAASKPAPSEEAHRQAPTAAAQTPQKPRPKPQGAATAQQSSSWTARLSPSGKKVALNLAAMPQSDANGGVVFAATQALPAAWVETWRATSWAEQMRAAMIPTRGLSASDDRKAPQQRAAAPTPSDAVDAGARPEAREADEAFGLGDGWGAHKTWSANAEGATAEQSASRSASVEDVAQELADDLKNGFADEMSSTVDAGDGETATADRKPAEAREERSEATDKAEKAAGPEAKDEEAPASAGAAGGQGGGGGKRGVSDAAKRMLPSGDQDFRATLARAVFELRASMVSVAVFSFVINLLILAIPIYLFQVSDRVLTSQSTETLVMLTIIVVGALAVYATLDVVRRFLLMRIATRFETTIGAPTVSAAARASQHGSAREFSAISDLAQLRNFLTGSTLISIFDAPIAPVYFLAVYLIHPQLGIIVTVAALLLLVIAVVNQKVTAVPYARASAFGQRANFQAEAMARSGEAVNAMGMIREGVTIWGREMSEALKAQVTAQDRNTIMTGLSKLLRLLTQVAMLCWGAYLAIDGQLTGGMMIAASIIASRALAPLEGLIEGWRGLVQARGTFARVQALLNSSPLNLDRLTLPRPQGRLSVERVLFVPPPTKKVILNGINFQLEPGEVMAIVGPSGTGKSTLAKMLVGSITPTSGSVRLDLMDIRNWDPRQFGETVGYLPQEVQLFPATIKANIARLREDVSDESIFDAAELADVHEMISQLPQGYETPIGMDGSPLSGGQKQRIGLARAFFGEPRLVVLDEPNSNLDTAGEAALASALERAKEKGITVIAVTQRPSLLRSVDKIMMLNEGKVQALGARDEVLPLLARGRSRKALPGAAQAAE